MGGGSWTAKAYVNHSTSVRGFATMDEFYKASTSQLYTVNKIKDMFVPMNVMRECCDSDEHKSTIPVILALDVTGSMGKTANYIAKHLDTIMKQLFDQVTDVEFCIMGIGDIDYDDAPIQIGQFESDIRIASQLENLYFERGGGGNSCESYTAAWYMAARHTKCDCWTRTNSGVFAGTKGIIITMGDEPLNMELRSARMTDLTGDKLQSNVKTQNLYKEVCEKWNVFHIAVDGGYENCYERYKDRIQSSFGSVLGQDLIVSTVDGLEEKIPKLIIDTVHSDRHFIKKQITPEEFVEKKDNSPYVNW